MTLRSRILARQETLSDLAWAAEQRHREADALRLAGYPSGAIYLYGLASEMILKNACFRFLGSTAATTVQAQLGPARTWMKTNAPAVDPESYHSLIFWTDYLILRRLERGRPLSREFTGLLRHHVTNRLCFDWKIDVRYRFEDVNPLEASRVSADANWLKSEKDRLWR